MVRKVVTKRLPVNRDTVNAVLGKYGWDPVERKEEVFLVLADELGYEVE